MQKIFDEIINTFIENKVGISNHFLNETLSFHLKENLLRLFSENKMQQAGIGNETIILKDKLFRNDKIYWLDRKHNNEFENQFFDLMDSFVFYLNEICYTGINDYEFHYTMYEEGNFYKKHYDQFRNNDSRQFSMIMYLNQDWKEFDGGELCIYHPYIEQIISPKNGKSVFFKSNELEHEVFITNKKE